MIHQLCHYVIVLGIVQKLVATQEIWMLYLFQYLHFVHDTSLSAWHWIYKVFLNKFDCTFKTKASMSTLIHFSVSALANTLSELVIIFDVFNLA